MKKNILELKAKEKATDLRDLGLNERQIDALRLMVNEGKEFTNREYREMFKVSAASAKRDLTESVRLNMANEVGKGRNLRYISKLSYDPINPKMTRLATQKNGDKNAANNQNMPLKTPPKKNPNENRKNLTKENSENYTKSDYKSESYEEDEEEIGKEIRISLNDKSVFTIKNEDKLSALRMKLDVEGIAVDEFASLFIEEIARHWNNRTVPTKFPWDLSWEEDLKDDIWHSYYRKFSDKKAEEIKENIGDVAYITGRKNFERNVKEKNLKVVEDGVAICDKELFKGLVITWDSDKGKNYEEISNKYSRIIKRETEKEFAKRRDEAKNRFKNQAELAEFVFYQFVRPYLLGILLSRATKGKAGSIVTSDKAISFVGKNKLVSKKFDALEKLDDNTKNDNEKRGGWEC